MTRLLSAVFCICERLFDGVYSLRASEMSSAETANNVPIHAAASALSRLYEPISFVCTSIGEKADGLVFQLNLRNGLHSISSPLTRSLSSAFCP